MGNNCFTMKISRFIRRNIFNSTYERLMPNTSIFIWGMRKKVLHELNAFKGNRFIDIGTRALEIFRDVTAIKNSTAFI